MRTNAQYWRPAVAASFPNPTLEAMGCGVPVVATNRGAVPEVTGGAAILLNDPRDEEEMLDAVCRVLDDEDLREMLRTKGLERAKEFTWEKTASKVFAVYRRIEKLACSSSRGFGGMPRNQGARLIKHSNIVRRSSCSVSQRSRGSG